MANASTTGFGLRAVMTVGNTPATSGQSEYKIFNKEKSFDNRYLRHGGVTPCRLSI